MCSGTLLSKNVVLTSAHCASTSSAGYVSAPDANGQTSSVKLVRTYDWTTSGDHSVQHDLALVVLSKSISIASYPKVWSHDADGLTARQSHRSVAAASDATVQSTVLAIANGRPKGNALTLYVPTATADAGGALFGTDANGKREVIGVMMGQGTRTKGGYATRVAESSIRSWITTVLANPTAVKAPTQNLAKMETLDDDDDDGGGDFGGGDFGGGDFGDDSQDQTTDDNQDTTNNDDFPNLPDDGGTSNTDDAQQGDTATPATSSDQTTGFPVSDTQQQQTTSSSASDSAPSWPTEPIQPSGVPTNTDSSIGNNQLQTTGFPVSDTQFQLIERENQNRMLDTFSTTQDGPGS